MEQEGNELNVSEIRHKAEMYCGKVIENDMAISVINEALDIIADLSDIHDEEVITISAAGGSTPDVDDWVILPSATTSIINVTDSSGDPYQDWQTRSNTITFSDAGTYTVLIKRMPEYVTALTDEPECHIMFHRLLSIYLRGIAKLSTDDNNQDGHAHIKRFYEEIARVAEVLKTNRKR